LIGLIFEGSHDLGVTMSLVDRGIGREEIKVLLAFRIPHINALSFGQHYGERVIVVGPMAVFEIHEILRRQGLLFGEHKGCVFG
jgi:hypothetical protein